MFVKDVKRPIVYNIYKFFFPKITCVQIVQNSTLLEPSYASKSLLKIIYFSTVYRISVFFDNMYQCKNIMNTCVYIVAKL